MQLMPYSPVHGLSLYQIDKLQVTLMMLHTWIMKYSQAKQSSSESSTAVELQIFSSFKTDIFI